MITHLIPYLTVVSDLGGDGGAPGAGGLFGLLGLLTAELPVGSSTGRHGPVRIPLYLASRRQGSRIDPGGVPRGARARRLRGALLLSDLGPAGARRGRQCAV